MQRRRTARSWGVASIFLIYQVSYHLPSKRHCTISVLPFDVIVSYKCCKDAHPGHKLATERYQRVHQPSLKCRTLRARRLAVIRKRYFASFYCSVHPGHLYRDTEGSSASEKGESPLLRGKEASNQIRKWHQAQSFSSWRSSAAPSRFRSGLRGAPILSLKHRFSRSRSILKSPVSHKKSQPRWCTRCSSAI